MSFLKLGKKPFVEDARDLKFEKYAADVPVAPPEFGHEQSYGAKQWGMLGNDYYGDCVFAGGDHEHMLWAKEGHHHDYFNARTALADYSAVTGFNPDDPSTDQGTVVRDALNYRRSTGLIGAGGVRHKISAYVALRAGDIDQLKRATYIFGAVGIGFQFPNTAMDQFNNGEPWDVARNASIEGGHYVPVVARRNGLLVCITWGQTQLMTDAFYAKYSDEAWAILDTEVFTAGKSPEGFDAKTLKADLAAL